MPDEAVTFLVTALTGFDAPMQCLLGGVPPTAKSNKGV